MKYQSLKAPEKGTVSPRLRNFEEWERAWVKAGYRERLGLLHELYHTSGGTQRFFRWLLETADEFRRLQEKYTGTSDHLRKIAEAALELAVKRTLRQGVLTDEHHDLACLFWFMRVEDGSFVNMSKLQLREPYAGYVWSAIDEECRKAFTREWNSHHAYRKEAIYLLDARDKLPLIIPQIWMPRSMPRVTFYPWSVFDKSAMQALEELALRDARKVGGGTVDLALIHGSKPAALYTAVLQAREALQAQCLA
ncbi:MAG TPA: hypothetical protein VGB97_00410 [Candidatus Paceibacterota bacterium]|jgi:hypothetical protein